MSSKVSSRTVDSLRLFAAARHFSGQTLDEFAKELGLTNSLLSNYFTGNRYSPPVVDRKVREYYRSNGVEFSENGFHYGQQLPLTNLKHFTGYHSKAVRAYYGLTVKAMNLAYPDYSKLIRFERDILTHEPYLLRLKRLLESYGAVIYRNGIEFFPLEDK